MNQLPVACRANQLILTTIPPFPPRTPTIDMRLAVLSNIVALSGLAVTQPDPTDIIAALTSLTTQCEDLMGPASQLSVLNAPLMLLGGGPWVVRPRCPPFSPKTAADRQSIINGFVDLVTDLDQVPATPPPPRQPSSPATTRWPSPTRCRATAPRRGTSWTPSPGWGLSLKSSRLSGRRWRVCCRTRRRP